MGKGLITMVQRHRLVKVGVFFLFVFGFVNSQLVYYISIVQIHHNNYTYFTQMSMVLGLLMVNRNIKFKT